MISFNLLQLFIVGIALVTPGESEQVSVLVLDYGQALL